MSLDNDTRGWIMTCLSGVACIFGALFIYIDIPLRLLPRMRDFRVQDSDGFLGCSLSLSAGVMLFSALYKMLPSAKKSLQEGGASSKAAAWILIAAFLGGVFGIQVFSRIVHRFMPSTAVDCDHTHGREEEESKANIQKPPGSRRSSHHVSGKGDERLKNKHSTADSEDTPLLSRSASNDIEQLHNWKNVPHNEVRHGRPSLQARVTATMANIVSEQKSFCEGDGDGQCYGFTNPCGPDCFKKMSRRSSTRHTSYPQPRSMLRRAATTSQGGLDGANEITAHTRFHDHLDAAADHGAYTIEEERDLEGQTLGPRPSDMEQRDLLEHDHRVDEAKDGSSPHHHHIPTNAFLAISLQTSIAIALHKLPEGFITYATNHANPTLGLAVFVAIAIHNITEGFALALPIYLATGSRLQALLVSVVLGGLSQPAGAGVAAAWLRLAERNRGTDADKSLSDRANGGMFAVTAGIMASVALSLLQESFELSHKKSLCMMFAFVGMGILGVSSALTA